ncbi:MAG: tripartite tricarboxylate transporter TctB family protein, partial [Polaromonas sp.]
RDSTDLIGGLFLTALGLFFVIYAQRYNMGTLNRMGPAYFPIALGAVLAFLGLLIAVPAWFRAGVGPEVSWKTLFIVIGSVVLFGATLQTMGLVFACMTTLLVASLADNDISWRERALLMVAVPPIIYFIFIFGLGMTVPVWPWSY